MTEQQADDYITQVLSSSGEHGVKLRLHEYKKQNGLCSASDAYEMAIESEQHRVEVLEKMQAKLTEKLRQEFRDQMEEVKTGLSNTQEHITKQTQVVMNQQNQLAAAGIGVTLASAANLSGKYDREKFSNTGVGQAALAYFSHTNIPMLSDMVQPQNSSQDTVSFSYAANPAAVTVNQTTQSQSQNPAPAAQTLVTTQAANTPSAGMASSFYSTPVQPPQAPSAPQAPSPAPTTPLPGQSAVSGFNPQQTLQSPPAPQQQTQPAQQ